MSESVAAAPVEGGLIARAESWVVRDLRLLAAAGTAGFLVGFVVNGWGSRLAMMLLARLNPRMTGVLSDDGFRMGRFDLADTLNLVVFATALGVVGGLLFLALRHLRFGPAWFQTTSMSVGPAVVVGALLIHTDGVDFRFLKPAWLAMALFIVLPGLFALAVAKVGDRFLHENSWFLTSRRGWAAGLLTLVLVIPLLPVVLAALIARIAFQTVPRVRRAVSQPWVAIGARVALTVVFALALVDLVRDATVLL